LAEPIVAQNRVVRDLPDEPVLVPIKGTAAADGPEAGAATPLATILTPVDLDGDVEEAPPINRQRAKPAPEPVLTVLSDDEPPSAPAVAEDEVQRVWVRPDLTLLDTVTVRKERLHDEIKANIRLIEQTLASFEVQATVI